MQKLASLSLSYRIALACWVVPLVVGVLVFALWCLTGWRTLMLVGSYAIVGGVVFFLVGLTALLRFYVAPRESAIGLLPSNGRSTLLCAALLFSNFPVAGAIVVAAYRIESCYVVVLRNESEFALTDIRITGGDDASLDELVPGGVAKLWLWPNHDDQLLLDFRMEGMQRSEVIDSYVTNLQGGVNTVTIRPSGAIEGDLIYR